MARTGTAKGRKPATRNPIAKAMRAALGGAHVAASSDTRPKVERPLAGKGSYRRAGKGRGAAERLA